MRHPHALLLKGRSGRPARWLAALSLFFLLAACAAMPVLPQPKGENDTLLIFTVGQHMDAKAGYLYLIELKLDTMEKPVVLRPWEKYKLVDGLEPGEHNTLTLTLVPNREGNWSTTGDRPKPQAFRIPFVMKAGGCTFFPIKFIYVMEVDPNDGRGSVRWDTKELSPEDIQKEFEGMKGLKNFKLWKIE